MRRDPANAPPDDLSAWLDGELDPDETAAIEAELERDPALKAAVADLEQVVAFVRRAGPTHAPAGFADRVLAQVEVEAARSSGAGWGWLRRPWGVPLEGWALGLAAAAAVALALLPDRPREPDPDAPRDVSPAALEVRTAPEDRPVVAEPEIIGRARVGDAVAKGVPTPPVTGDGSAPPTGTADPEAVVAKGEPAPPGPELGTGSSAYTGAIGTAPREGGYGTSEVGGVVGAPVQLVVASGDPGVKREVMAVAARYAGTARQNGLPVTDAKMSGPSETLTVTLPQARLTSFTRALRDLGYDVAIDTSEALVGGGAVEVAIELRWSDEADSVLRSLPPPLPAANE